MEKAFKFRLCPSKEQEILLNKSFGSARFVYNYFLHKRIEYYEQTGKTLTYNPCSKLLAGLKAINFSLKK